MSDDLDLRGIDGRYEPNPQFRAALRDRVAAIVDGADPDVVTESLDLVTVDLEPTNAPSAPSRNRRLVAQVILAAAAIVAIALVASRDDDSAPADQPSPTVTVPPSTPPRALTAYPDRELLAPGTYFVDDVDGTPTPRIFVTIGTGWTNWSGSGIDKHGRPGPNQVEDDVGFITFSRPDKVYVDACHLSDGFNPRHVRTLDGLVTALMEQQGGWVDVTAPSDISIDGYPGKTFQRTVPAVLSNCPNHSPGRMRDPELDGNGLSSWLDESEESVAGLYYEPGQVETLVVLDIDGTVVVINANLWAGSSAADRAVFADVLDSIRIASSPDDESTPADQPSPNVTAPETAPPRSLRTAEQHPEQLVPGTYFVDDVDGTLTPRIFVTVGAGWTGGYGEQSSLGLWKTGQGVGVGNQAGGLTFSHPGDEVFSDACHPSEGYTAGDVATLDGLVNALRTQAGWAEVTLPSDISVDGYAGKAFQRTAPTDMSGCDTAGPSGRRDGSFGMHPDFRSWEQAGPYEQGKVETVWVLDVDGTVVVINTTAYSDASEADRAELAAALDSIRIEQG